MDSNNDKDQTAEQEDKVVVTANEENRRGSIKGRPNIAEISKRNDEEEKRDRKSFYLMTGTIMLSIIVVILLVYFFS